MNNKQRRQIRRRNFLARELHEPRYGPRIVPDKRRFLIDKIHEDEADDDLFEYFGIGKAPKE